MPHLKYIIAYNAAMIHNLHANTVDIETYVGRTSCFLMHESHTNFIHDFSVPFRNEAATNYERRNPVSSSLLAKTRLNKARNFSFSLNVTKFWNLINFRYLSMGQLLHELFV